jgi:hypothetical protein
MDNLDDSTLKMIFSQVDPESRLEILKVCPRWEDIIDEIEDEIEEANYERLKLDHNDDTIYRLFNNNEWYQLKCLVHNSNIVKAELQEVLFSWTGNDHPITVAIMRGVADIFKDGKSAPQCLIQYMMWKDRDELTPEQIDAWGSLIALVTPVDLLKLWVEMYIWDAYDQPEKNRSGYDLYVKSKKGTDSFGSIDHAWRSMSIEEKEKWNAHAKEVSVLPLQKHQRFVLELFIKYCPSFATIAPRDNVALKKQAQECGSFEKSFLTWRSRQRACDK